MSELEVRVQSVETHLGGLYTVIEELKYLLKPSTNTTGGARHHHLRRRPPNKGLQSSESKAVILIARIEKMHGSLAAELGYIKDLAKQPQVPAITDQSIFVADEQSSRTPRSTSTGVNTSSINHQTPPSLGPSDPGDRDGGLSQPAAEGNRQDMSALQSHSDGPSQRDLAVEDDQADKSDVDTTSTTSTIINIESPVIDATTNTRSSVADGDASDTTEITNGTDVSKGMNLVTDSTDINTANMDTNNTTDNKNDTADASSDLSTDETDSTDAMELASTSVEDNMSTSAEDDVSTNVEDNMSTDVEDNVSTDVEDNVSTDVEDNVSTNVADYVSTGAGDDPSSNMDCASIRARFNLTSAQMGEKLIPALAELMNHPDFSNEATAPPFDGDLNKLRDEVLINDTYYTSNKYQSRCNGYANLYSSNEKPTFVWPDFSVEAPDRPTQIQVEEFLEETISHPPKGEIPYYGGTASRNVNTQLHPGKTLAEFKQATGINSEFYHIGSRYSSTAFHCEDTNLQSCNVTDYGWKVWLVIKTHHTAKFEEFVRDTWGGCKCQQFVRHLNLLVAPSRLRKEGIEFDIRCTGRGQMIITEAHQYHYTMNYSQSVARSINFLLPGNQMVLEGVPVCKECGFYALQSTHPVRIVPSPKEETSQAQKRRAPAKVPLRPSKITRSQADATKRADHWSEEIKEITKWAKKQSIRVPILKAGEVPDPVVFKLATTIWSRDAVKTFCSAVEYQTTPRSIQHVPLSSEARSRDPDSSLPITERAKRLARGEKRTEIDILITRYDLLHLYEDMEARKQRTASRRSETVDIQAVRDATGWTIEQYKYKRTLGQEWERLCGPYKGLLCFVPLHMTVSQVHKLTEEQLQQFHRLLDDDYIRSICSAAEIFLKALDTSDKLDFAWKGMDVKWDALEESMVLAMIRSLSAAGQSAAGED